MKVGVVGGGLAGLSVAYELSSAGHRVTVFEKEAQLGGQAATFEIAGERLEMFYHHIFSSDVDIIQLIHELGLDGRLEWLDSRVGFYHGGTIYDFVTALDLMRFSPVSLFDRLRLGLLSLYLRWYRNWPRMEGVTAKEWLLKYGGRRNFEVVWGPLLRNKFGSRYDEVGMVWLWGKIHLRFSSRQGGRERLGYMAGSFGVLADALQQRIIDSGGEVLTSSPVEQVMVEDGRATGVRVREQSHQFDAVIATVPSPAFLSMAPSLPEEYAGKLRGVPYQVAVCLVLVLKHSLSGIYWLNISDPSIPFVAVIEHSNLVDPAVYGGKRIAYVSNYLSHDHRLTWLSADALLAEYAPHLRKINPEFEPGWVEEARLFREPAGQPIVTTSYSLHIPDHRTPVPNLYLANTTQIYPEDRGMNYSVRLGRRVARLVASQA
ncbi:MAG: NAD(P)/FAD-dependent oxidoreductase [Chloroflexota bacterium]|nr:NAD(P)/FAD-dependent oxidoreductase [Chloroflexota bacterium]